MADVMFSGSSRYANDFKTLIDRSVAIASLPLSMMRNQGDRIDAERKALESLDARLDALRSALSSVKAAAGGAALHGTTTDGNALTVTTTAAASPGSYTLSVDSLGAYENVMSAPATPATTDPAKGTIGTSPSFDLVCNGTTVRVTGSNLTQIAADINRLAGKDVQAGVVNLGTAGYCLTVRSRHLRSESIALYDASDSGRATNLLPDVVTEGASVQWRVNGANAASTGESRTVTLAPGVTVNLLDTTEENKPAVITVERSTGALEQALTDLSTSWNAAVAELDTHRGSTAGALAGNSVLSTASDLLRTVSLTKGGGATDLSAAALGIHIDDKGRMTFRSADLSAAADKNGLDAIMDWFGASDGFGATAEAAISRISGEGTKPGILDDLISSATQAANLHHDRMEAEEERIDKLRMSLEEQFSAADALIASLEQQAGYITSMFDAMRAASENQ